MATIGKYCKAYSLQKLRQFNQWAENENSENTRKEKQEVDDKEVEVNSCSN